jgi:shikimate dehydrogenase
MSRTITGHTTVAGIAGAPVTHSLSPLIHNAWLGAAAVDGVYVAFTPAPARFAAFVEGLRGGAVRGINVTVPFKETALEAADTASDRARAAGAANLLIFAPDGTIHADNTDGLGLMRAIAEQAPGYDAALAPAVVLGAGGATRGAVAALLEAGTPQVRLLNRTAERARVLAQSFGDRVVVARDVESAFGGAGLIINATTLGMGGGEGPAVPFEAAPDDAVAMDMVYRPLRTDFLHRAAQRGLRTVDGLAMLIGQAGPSFEALFGTPQPPLDVRALALRALGEDA